MDKIAVDPAKIKDSRKTGPPGPKTIVVSPEVLAARRKRLQQEAQEKKRARRNNGPVMTPEEIARRREEKAYLKKHSGDRGEKQLSTVAEVVEKESRPSTVPVTPTEVISGRAYPIERPRKSVTKRERVCEIKELLQQEDLNPLKELVRMCKDSDSGLKPYEKARILSDITNYIYPKLKAVDKTVTSNSNITIVLQSPEGVLDVREVEQRSIAMKRK